MPTPIRRTAAAAAGASTLASIAQRWAEGFNFNSRSAVSKLDVARKSAPTTGPAAVQRAYALYKSWEDNDLGSVRLLEVKSGGKSFFALHTTTDGDAGFLELYSDRGALLKTGVTGFDAGGKRNITWDSKPGAVRERVAPRDASSSVKSFFNAVGEARKSSSPSGATVSTAELRAAAKHLVGAELTTASVDGFERAGLLRTLTEEKLTPTSREYGRELAALYESAPNPKLSRVRTGPLGSASPFQQAARTASATVAASSLPVRADTMSALAQRAFGSLPAQLAPVTRAEAQALLRQAGATSGEAKAAVDGLAESGGQLYAGRFFEQGSSGTDWLPVQKGLALFGVSSSGRELKALEVPLKAQPNPALDPRAIIQQLVGVDRPVQVTATRTTATGTQHDLAWNPPTGGQITATLNVPNDGSEASIEGVQLPPVIGSVETSLADRVSAALGSPRRGLAYAQIGSDWLVAHQAEGGTDISLSRVKIALGGATASVTDTAIGTTAAQTEAARFLALGLARVHAAGMVAAPDGSEAARLEVALRTRWAQPSSLELVVADESPVGFDAANDRLQLMLPSVWGDNAVFVTFQKDGRVRLEDFN